MNSDDASHFVIISPEFAGDIAWINDVYFSPDEKHVAIATTESIQLFHIEELMSGALAQRTHANPYFEIKPTNDLDFNYVADVTFSCDSNFVAVACGGIECDDSHVALYHIGERRLMWSSYTHDEFMRNSVFMNQELVFIDTDGSRLLSLDLNTFQVSSFAGHPIRARKLANGFFTNEQGLFSFDVMKRQDIVVLWTDFDGAGERRIFGENNLLNDGLVVRFGPRGDCRQTPADLYSLETFHRCNYRERAIVSLSAKAEIVLPNYHSSNIDPIIPDGDTLTAYRPNGSVEEVVHLSGLFKSFGHFSYSASERFIAFIRGSDHMILLRRGT